MAINFPGPYEVEYQYETPIGGETISHVLRVNCSVIGTPAPGTLPADINVQTVSGTPQPLDESASSLWDYLRPFVHSTVSCSGYTLWKYTPGTFEKTYITAGTVDNPAGFSGGTPQPAHMFKLTMRTAAGGILGITVLEDGSTANNVVNVSSLAVDDYYRVLANYLLSADGWVLARDDSFPIASLKVSFGENEATWKQRYRS